MYFLSKINSTNFQGSPLHYSSDGAYLLTVDHPSSSTQTRKIHFYRFSNPQIFSHSYDLSENDMQYPYGDDNYAIRTFNGNAICYILGWGLNGGFSIAKITYSKKKEKVDGIEFLYWSSIGLSDLK